MMLAAVGLMSFAGVVGRFAVIAYLPVCVQALWPVRGLSASPSLGRLGAAWVAQSALFTVLLAALV